MTLQIREAPFAEIAGLANEVVDSGAFVTRVGDDRPFVLEAPELFADHPDFRIFAAFGPDDVPVAFAMALPTPEPSTVDIGPTYVAARMRGRGVGSALISHVVEWARMRGKRRVAVATWGQNARARRVFERAGFEIVREDANARVNGDSTVHFELSLGSAA